MCWRTCCQAKHLCICLGEERKDFKEKSPHGRDATHVGFCGHLHVKTKEEAELGFVGGKELMRKIKWDECGLAREDRIGKDRVGCFWIAVDVCKGADGQNSTNVLTDLRNVTHRLNISKKNCTRKCL